MGDEVPAAKRRRMDDSADKEDRLESPVEDGSLKSPSSSSSVSQEDKPLTHEDIESIARFIQSKTSIKPGLGIICGSGLGRLAEDLDTDKPSDVIAYSDIPKFPRTTVKGHKGNLVFGYLSGHPVVCMQGRFHFYEGHAPWKITMPVRVMRLLGVHTLIVTNAAGGLNESYSFGDIMIMKDHLNLAGMAGANPLIGENEQKFGSRFTSMSTAYDKELREIALSVAEELNISSFTREGVYVHLSGPSYETPSECKFLRLMGADAVGMSTAPEVVVAKHCNMKVLGISLITNMCIMDHDSTKPGPSHQEVMETADMRAQDMQRLVKTVVDKYCSNGLPGNSPSKL